MPKNKKEILEKARQAKKDKMKNKVNKSNGDLNDEYENTIKPLEKLSKKLFDDENKLFEIEDELSKIGNFQILPSKGRSKKQNYFRVLLYADKYSNHKSYSRNKINKVSEEVSKSLKSLKLKGKISMGVDFDGKFRNGEFTKIGRTPRFFEPNILSPTEEDEEVIKEYKNKNKFRGAVFFIHAENSKYKKGGKGYNNDCLFYCIRKAIPEFNPWKHPEDLKTFLQIGRNDMISIDLMEKIEKKIGKVGINVSGDFSYTSKLGLLKNIHLNLINNHYTINHKINSKSKFVSFEPRKILMIKKSDKIGYDGTNYIQMTDEYYSDLYSFKTPYIITTYQGIVKRDENKKILRDEEGKSIKYTLEEEYERYIKVADDLKLKSNGEIDIYKTGTILSTAERLLDETTKHLNPETILLDEAEQIQASTHGATIFYENYEGEAYKGDIKSMFPYIMSNQYTLIPFQRGIFKLMTTEEFNDCINKKIIPYGLYKVKIYKSNVYKIDRWFRFDIDNNYTSIDIKHALDLGLKMEILTIDEDDENLDWNVILYPRKTCLKSDEVFSNYINKLFPLKEQGVEGSKLLLSIMSGAIGEINKIKIKVYEDEEGEDVDFDEMGLIPIKITSNMDHSISTYTCVDKDKYYKSSFARYKPFLWSQARYMMTKLFYPKYNDVILKCYTDGIISSKPLEYSNGLGQLKYEGFCSSCKIINNANVEGKFQV
jgi:hypothetical protein